MSTPDGVDELEYWIANAIHVYLPMSPYSVNDFKRMGYADESGESTRTFTARSPTCEFNADGANALLPWRVTFEEDGMTTTYCWVEPVDGRPSTIHFRDPPLGITYGAYTDCSFVWSVRTDGGPEFITTDQCRWGNAKDGETLAISRGGGRVKQSPGQRKPKD